MSAFRAAQWLAFVHPFWTDNQDDRPLDCSGLEVLTVIKGTNEDELKERKRLLHEMLEETGIPHIPLPSSGPPSSPT